MKLSHLISGLKADFLVPKHLLEQEITGLAQHIDQVVPGSVFVAIKGTKFDGHQNVEVALKKGATAVVIQNGSMQNISEPEKVITAQSTQMVWAWMSHVWFTRPSERLSVFAVTGTNGKTTTAYMIEHVLSGLNKNTLVIGTIDHHLKNKIWNTQLTTPDAYDVQNRLQEALALNAQALAIEVSSHALDQNRAFGMQFDCAIFTNLSRDHLDYHQDMQGYFCAKKKLFTELLNESSKKNKIAVVNIDDEWGKKLYEDLKNLDFKIVRISSLDNKAELFFQVLNESLQGLQLQIQYENQSVQFVLPLVGKFNAYNACGVIAAMCASGYQLKKVIEVFTTFSGTPGRLQLANLKSDNKPFVFVDYAHTPDALEKSLQALSKLKHSAKLWAVFGCGGDRDRGKRPMMAKIAESFADHVIVTSDNPRSENPESIIGDIKSGFKNLTGHQFIIDRKQAIHRAVEQAKPGDIVLIAGKGHENYQLVGSQKIDFSDIQEARKALDARA